MAGYKPPSAHGKTVDKHHGSNQRDGKPKNAHPGIPRLKPAEQDTQCGLTGLDCL